MILTVMMSFLNAACLLVSTQLSLLPKNNQIKKNKHISQIISDYHQLLVYFLSSSSLSQSGREWTALNSEAQLCLYLYTFTHLLSVYPFDVVLKIELVSEMSHSFDDFCGFQNF